MMKITMKALVLLILLMAVPVMAQDAADQQAGMERWMKASTPGEFHEFLAKKKGNWNIAGKMWMEPGGEPQTTSSTGEAKMILGGRFLYETMEGSMMGMPVEGLGITGYDNTSGVVTSIWYDNTGTVTTVLKGKWEKPGAPLEMHGETWDPMSGLDMKIRTVTTFISADESTFEYFASGETFPEMKVMELRYTRAE